MHQTNLNRVNLNLLVVFDAIARTGAVTSAAEELTLSQPAVSHALNRLRELISDPLFVRSGKGLTLTPRAEAMRGPVRNMLDSAASALSSAAFDPLTTTQAFRIGASDYGIMTIVPDVVRKLRSLAPYAALDISPVGADLMQRMERGELDLAFVGVRPTDHALHCRELFSEHFVGLICGRHPITSKNKQGRVSLADYLAYPHVVVSFGTLAPSQIDTKLQEMGKTRRVVMRSPNFTANMASLIDTDLVMSLPSRLASVARLSGVVTFKLPVLLPDFPYLMTWHRRSDADPAAKWLRTIVVDAVTVTRPSQNTRRQK